MFRRSLRILLTALTLTAAGGTIAVAEDIGDSAAGRALAEKWCNACHIVGASQTVGTSNGAPTFAAVAQMKSTTRLSLRVFLQTPHDRMPNLQLNRDEIDNVSAYILSLRTAP
jgi:mono/diheme cytochrome c family protein